MFYLIRGGNYLPEKSGLLDDSAYIRGLANTSFIDAHENVFAFSSHLSSMEVLQMLNLVIAPSGITDVGQQMYHFVIGNMDISVNLKCDEHCFFQTIVGKGDLTGIEVFSKHQVAAGARLSRKNS